MKQYKDMTIGELALECVNDWRNQFTAKGKRKEIYFGAVPYLDAMRTMNSINDAYGLDTGKSIVAYFLANAHTWKGDVARDVKAELKRRLNS